MTAPQVLELPLDDALLKVLSSESRREILRLLAERRMTGAEMAVRLNLGKPAVSEHLKKLTESGLIERADDPERRWVYYNLSSRGRSILEPQRVRFYLVMAVATLALVLGMALALGFTVFLAQGNAAAGGLDTAETGQTYLGSDAYQPPARSASVPVIETPMAWSTSTADESGDASKVAAVTVVTVPHKICPVGKTCTTVDEDAAHDEPEVAPAAFVLVLPDGQVAPPPATSVVYAFHEADVNALLNTITVHPIDADTVGDVAQDLGVPDADLATLASMAGAITLQTGGTLLPLASDVNIPVVTFNADQQAAAFSLTQAIGRTASRDVQFSDSVDERSMSSSSVSDTPATSDAATAEAPRWDASVDDSGADGSEDQPDSALPTDDSALAPVAPTPAGARDATPTNETPIDEAPGTAVDDELSATTGNDGHASQVPGQPSTQDGAEEDNVDADGASLGGSASRTPFVPPAQGREPADSAILPFLAIIVGAVLVGLVRRRDV